MTDANPKMPSPAELVEALTARVKDPTRRALVAALGTKMAVLTAQAVLAGGGPESEPVSRELAHVRSQVASLTALEVFALREAVTSWLTRFVEAALVAALSA